MHLYLHLGIFLVLSSLFSSTLAYTIGLKPGDKECYIISLESDQPCSGSYEVITKSPDPINVTVTGPDGTINYQNDPYADHGFDKKDDKMDAEDEPDSGDAFQFDAILEGDYTMCLHYDKEMSDDTEERILAFNFRATNSAPGFKKDYNGFESELDALQRGLDTLKHHHAYMSQREDVHKTALDTINFKVLCWTIMESIILIVTAIWQIKYIGSFFERKLRM
jgi:hypothetical protein